MKYTIEDLRNGKCAVVNDGTVEQLNEVLKKAFPGSLIAAGGFKYYFANPNILHKRDCSNRTNLPTQKVKDFLEEEWTPKVGELVEVSNDEVKDWPKRIFVCQHDGKFHCVSVYKEREFHNNTGYKVFAWSRIRQIKQPEIEITVKINGKESKLSDISEDTLLKIRSKS